MLYYKFNIPNTNYEYILELKSKLKINFKQRKLVFIVNNSLE